MSSIRNSCLVFPLIIASLLSIKLIGNVLPDELYDYTLDGNKNGQAANRMEFYSWTSNNSNAINGLAGSLPVLPGGLYVGEQLFLNGSLINTGDTDITDLQVSLSYNTSQVSMNVEILDFSGVLGASDTVHVRLSVVPFESGIFEPEVYFRYELAGTSDTLRWELRSLIYSQNPPEWHRVADLDQAIIRDAVSGDFNQDGWMDFAIADPDSVVVYYNTQSADFKFDKVTVFKGKDANIELFDVDKDGVGELILMTQDNDIYEIDELEFGGSTPVYINHKAGTRATFEIIDMDGNGDAELILCNEGYVRIFNYPSFGPYYQPFYQSQQRQDNFYKTFDVNGDGRLEYLVEDGFGCYYDDCEYYSVIIKIDDDGSITTTKTAIWFGNAIDINQDGFGDLVSDGTILLNDGMGGWLEATHTLYPTYKHQHWEDLETWTLFVTMIRILI